MTALPFGGIVRDDSLITISRRNKLIGIRGGLDLAKLRSGLPWWAMLLLVLTILAILGVVVYFIVKFIVLIVLGLFIGICVWAYVKHKTSSGTVHDDGSGHYSDDDIDYQDMDTTGGQKPSRSLGHEYFEDAGLSTW